MILTIQENYDKKDGSSLPMFSRSGKSTINQYLAFNQSGKKRSVDISVAKQQDDFDVDQDDIGLMMGDKPNNID